MKHVITFILAAVFVSAAARGEWTICTSVTPEIARGDSTYAELLRRCKTIAERGYMRVNPVTPASALPPGWESVERDPRVREYHYPVSDPGVDGGKKEGWVILFDPEAERLAAWIANAVIETSADQKSYSQSRGLALADFIYRQSGAQFPIVGLVWEDMEGTSHPKAYGFLDGITVSGAPAGFYDGQNRTTAKLPPETLKEGLAVRWEGRAQAGKYARISSTTRDEVLALYEKMGKPAPDVKGNAYAAYVRATYQSAMSSARNELIVASARK